MYLIWISVGIRFKLSNSNKNVLITFLAIVDKVDVLTTLSKSPVCKTPCIPVY